MPRISIVTAVYAPRSRFLSQTSASIAALKMPAEWDLEWVIQEDGDSPQLSEFFGKIPYAKYDANGRQLGIASTRNLALSRASGFLTQALDHDDILLPHAFTTLIPHFSNRQIHWAIGQADDLMPDGAHREYPSPIDFGLLNPGTVNDWAIRHQGNWPIHGAALMMRSDTLRAVGGWAGIPYDDELCMFAALSEITHGYYDEAMTWLYRHHEGQTHRTQASRSLSEPCRRIALQRAMAVRALGVNSTETPGSDFDSKSYRVEVGPALKDAAS
jgi:glycosyltransferase involved in cell wall biosynthesis